MACKHGDEYCGTHWYCGTCTRESYKAAYARLTPQQRDYDRHVDPLGAYSGPIHDDEPSGCSCHISAPCSYCTRETEESPEHD